MSSEVKANCGVGAMTNGVEATCSFDNEDSSSDSGKIVLGIQQFKYDDYDDKGGTYNNLMLGFLYKPVPGSGLSFGPTLNLGKETAFGFRAEIEKPVGNIGSFYIAAQANLSTNVSTVVGDKSSGTATNGGEFEYGLSAGWRF